MTMDSTLIPSSLHSLAEFDIPDGENKKCDRNRDPKQVLHTLSKPLSFPSFFGGVEPEQLALLATNGQLPDLHARMFARIVSLSPKGIKEVEQKGTPCECNYDEDCYGCHFCLPEAQLRLLRTASFQQPSHKKGLKGS
jgi:hypothetical protein